MRTHHRLLAAWVVAAGIAGGTGCLWATKQSQASGGLAASTAIRDDGGLTGGSLDVQFTMAGLGFGLELGGHDLELAAPGPGDTRSFVDLSGLLTLRLAPLGIFPGDHALERWFDFGFEAGVGGGGVAWAADKWSSVETGFVGGFVEVGTFSLPRTARDEKTDHRYVAVVATVRQLNHGDPWQDEVVVGIGLAYRIRGLLGPFRD